MSSVSMRDLLEAGAHFGHQARYWNPKMRQYIFGARNDIHIINLEKTVPALNEALAYVRDMAAKKNKVLFVVKVVGGAVFLAGVGMIVYATKKRQAARAPRATAS